MTEDDSPRRPRSEPASRSDPLDTQRLILAAAATGSHRDPHRLGYAVIDTGATETVGSLDAVEFVTTQRARRFGPEDIGVDPHRVKRFKFGNAEERMAESYLLLPQSVNGQQTSLGVYTLDVPGVINFVGNPYHDQARSSRQHSREHVDFHQAVSRSSYPFNS